MGSDAISHRVTTGLFYHRVQRYCYFRKVSIHFTLNIILALIFLRNTVRFIQYASNQTNTVLFILNVIQLLLLISGDVEMNRGPNSQEHSISILHLNIRSIRQKIEYILSDAHAHIQYI